MIQGIKKQLCTGCSGCSNICPKSAIVMLKDKEGFWYPKVDTNKCDKCGRCILKCPSLKKYVPENSIENPEVFAAWSNDEENRFYSTSGGIFTELARMVMSRGGLVVGAQYTNEFLVEHVIIENPEELQRLRQSKYLQSDIGNIYKRILEVLENGNLVLFCGTPCQNAGLSSFLGKDYTNLIKCDFICRGVISPTVFKKYLYMLEKRHKQSVKRVTFKNKTSGWNQFCTLIEFKDGQQYIQDRNNDLYMVGYLKYNLYMRPCCHECKYKEFPRVSDITLGDFWGIGKTRPHLDENKGTSVVILNSPKGESIFSQIKNKITCEQCTMDEAIDGNACLLQSTLKGKYREIFFNLLETESFDTAFYKAINGFNK